MSVLPSSKDPQDYLYESLEYDGVDNNVARYTTSAMSKRSGVVVGRPSEADMPQEEISAGQKMLSAVSGSILTSLIGKSSSRLSCLMC